MRVGGRPVWLLLACAGAVALAHAADAEPAGRGGEEYVLSRSYETSSRGSNGSSGSSRGRDELVERVIGAREGGLELEFDLPRDAAPEERARQWAFPARVLRAADGSARLLNEAELDARLDAWLKRGGLTRAHCGRWGFSWTAYRIECEPGWVLKTIAEFDPRPRGGALRDGAPFSIEGARGPGTLARTAARTGGGEMFAVVMDAESEAVRRERAESDVVVGEIMKTPVTLEAALAKRAKEAVSGTIRVTFEVDGAGTVWRRTRVTRLETTEPDGASETSTATETVERRPARAR